MHRSLAINSLNYTVCYILILITKSWLHINLTNDLLDTGNKYYIIQKDRNRNSGGVCAMVDKKLRVLGVCLSKCLSNLELVCFDISCGCNSITS